MLSLKFKFVTRVEFIGDDVAADDVPLGGTPGVAGFGEGSAFGAVGEEGSEVGF